MTKSLHRHVLIVGLGTAFVASCGMPQTKEKSHNDSLITSASNKWPNPYSIPLCWVNPEDTTQEVLNVFRSTIEEEYTRKAEIYFTGFGKCPSLSSNDLQKTPTIRIKLDVTGTTYNETTGAWGTPGGLSKVGLNAGKYFIDDGTWGTRVGAPDKWVNLAGLRTDTLNILIHELGHALGLEHEHVRGDISSGDAGNDCSKNAGGSSESGATRVGNYDHDSVMNYCITRMSDNSRPFRLTQTDIQGLYNLYPPRNTGLSLFNNLGNAMTERAFVATHTWVGDWNFNAADNSIVGSGDFNGDGRKEVLVRSGWGLGVFAQNGTGFSASVVQPRDTWFGAWRYDATVNEGRDRFVGVGDLNGDGKDDVLLQSNWGLGAITQSGSSFASLVAKPNGTFFGGWNSNSADNSIVAVADFNGDGRKDVLVRSPWGIGILSLNGDSFTSLVAAPRDTWFGAWRWDATVNTGRDVIAGVGDFNGDGRADILVKSDWGVGLLTLQGNSLVALVAQPRDTWFGGWRWDATVNTGRDRIAAIGDINGDRRADFIVLSNWGITALTLDGASFRPLVVKPKGTFFGGWNFNPDDNSVLGIGDFNGDGRGDILIKSPWGLGQLSLQGDTFASLDLHENVGAQAMGRVGNWTLNGYDRAVAIGNFDGRAGDEFMLQKVDFFGLFGGIFGLPTL